MVQDGHADLTFTYTPIYQGDRRRGDPDYIEFLVNRVGGNTPQAVEGDLFATIPKAAVPKAAVPVASAAGLTKDQAQEAYRRCYPDFKAQLGLSGADVWFMDYQDGVVTFSYDRNEPELAERLTVGADCDTFATIVKKYFGEKSVIKFRQSGC